MSVKFRPLLPDDYQVICNLVLNKEELFMVYPKGQFPFTVDQFEAMLARRVEPTVLTIDGEVAGFAAFYQLRKARFVFIGNVIVDRNRRGSGLGRKLVSYMSEMAFGKYNLPEVRISVHNRNTRALILYTSLGFNPYAIQSKTDPRGHRVALISLSLRREN